MFPMLLYFLVPASLLLGSALVIFLWDRARDREGAREPGNGRPEGAFRAFYHALWILILWTGLVLSLPLWVSFRERLGGLAGIERWMAVGKLLLFPVVLLFALYYGARQGYLKWIDGLEWPDKESR